MGNQLNFSSYEDPEGPGDNVAFFKGLQLKQLKSVFASLQETRISDFNVNNYEETISWRQYFQLFSKMKEKMDADAEVLARTHWHVATQGYEMTPQERVEEEVEESNTISGARDDWTDDDLSEDEASPSASVSQGSIGENSSQKTQTRRFSAGGLDSVGGSSRRENDSNTKESSVSSSTYTKPKKVPKNWDSQFTNPIFFGYSNYKTSEKVENQKLEAERTKIQEERAIVTAQESRVMFIDEFDKAIKNQEAVRLKKLSDLETKYNTVKAKSQAEYDRNERDTPELAFKQFKTQWLDETTAAELAFEAEMKTMNEFNIEKTKFDRNELRKKKEELEAFKDVNKQEVPAAERLEIIARLEIKRWIDEVEAAGVELEKARADFRNIKDEVVEQKEANTAAVQKKGSAAAAKANAEAMRLRSMMNVAATGVKTTQKRLERALEGLGDAKVLLHRAVRIYNQQRAFLPLFKLLSPVSEEEHVLPTECCLNYLLTALIFLFAGTFDQKLTLLFGLYDIKAEGMFPPEFIVSLVMLCQQTLHKMRCVPYLIDKDSIINSVERSFIDMQLDIHADALTHYEAKLFLLSLFGKSWYVSKLLGVFGSVAANATGSNNDATTAIQQVYNPHMTMGTYQRNQMSAFSLLRTGLIMPTVAKYRLHFEGVKYRACLNPQHRQLIHERALAMGAEDPLKPDYSQFLGDKNKKKNKHIVEPLDHGHLNNISFIDLKKHSDAAVRIQSLYRTRKEIKRAELLARKQAFQEAKEIALREMKEKVVKEFKARESGTGVGKMKWDAQVRMRQAKAKVSGGEGEHNYSRSEMVLIMMEETIAKAENDIREKFRSIEQNEAFIGVEFDHDKDDEKKLTARDAHEINVEAMFGMFFSSSQAEDPEVMVESIATPRPDDPAAEATAKALATKKGSSKQEGDGEDDNEEGEGGSGPGPALASALSKERTQEIVMATFVSNSTAVVPFTGTAAPGSITSGGVGNTSTLSSAAKSRRGTAGTKVVINTTRGDTQAESEFRQLMSIAEPATAHVLARIRALDNACTLIKAAGVLSELPTKRLLLKYIQHHAFDKLNHELCVHFRIVRNTHLIARALKRICNTDLEQGTLVNDMLRVQQQVEGGIKHIALQELRGMNTALREVINRRLLSSTTDPGLIEEENLSSEVERIDYSVNKYTQQSDELLAAIAGLKERFRRTQLSVNEAEKRRRSLQLLQSYVRTQKYVYDAQQQQLQQQQQKEAALHHHHHHKHHNQAPASLAPPIVPAANPAAAAAAQVSHLLQIQALEQTVTTSDVTIEDRYSWSKRLQQAMKLVNIQSQSQSSGIMDNGGTSIPPFSVGKSVASLNKQQSALFTNQLTLSSLGTSQQSLGQQEEVDDADAETAVDEETMMAKYSEIRNVCREFLDIASLDARTIISEHKQPKHRKTIPVYAEHVVHGRVNECGRGDTTHPQSYGKYYTYLAHNIEYKVIEDYDGVFNGSDDYAAKALGGNERRNALEMFKAHIPALNIPLMAVIDYAGFRCVAVAKQPTEVVSFTEDGEIRKMSEELVHGVLKCGNHFINKSAKVAQRLLKIFALRMNLSEHSVKGFNDITASTTWASSELKVYKGWKDEFYCTTFFRCLPAEMAELTPHLPRVPRDQSVFWRQLRPELLKHYDGAPLSPDAISTIVSDSVDRYAQYEASLSATRYLMSVVVPACLNVLIYRDYSAPLSEGLGLDLAAELHCRGVNMRHLGHMRAMLWRDLPGTVNVYFHEQCVRTSKDQRQEVRAGDTFLIEGKTYTITADGENNGTWTPKSIPIQRRYVGESKNRLTARVGSAASDKNSAVLRQVFLAEMVARGIKYVIRLQLRAYASRERITSLSFTSAMLAEYFNVVSGASAFANKVLMESVYETVRERFGNYAILPSEQRNLQHELAPCTLFIIKRLQSMLGVRLSLSCVSEFHERPQGFLFSPVDFIEISPVVQHNIPLLAFSEAVLLSLQAQQAEKEVYLEQVLRDMPVVCFRLSERAGSRTAENISYILGSRATNPADRNLVDGTYSHYCDLEQEGPIASDPYIRSVGFKLETKAWCETKFHPFAVPLQWQQHFSVELFVRCTGAHNQSRTAIMNGRFAVMASRDNNWTFVLMQEMLEVNVRLAPVAYNAWAHIMATFDGTTLRCYFDSLLVAAIEAEPVMAAKMAAFEDDIKAKRDALAAEEADERAHLKISTQKEAETYFNSKAGGIAMKKAAQDIMESAQYNIKDGGEDGDDGDSSPVTAAPSPKGRSVSPSKGGGDAAAAGQQSGKNNAGLKQRRAEALRQAKSKYVTDLYVKNVREVALRYKQLEGEIDDFRVKCIEQGQLRSRKGMRIGAALGSSSLKDGKSFFVGNVSCVSVYTTALSSDRIRGHYLAVVGNKTKQAQRLYAETAGKYEEAITFAPDDPLVLKGYAKALCQYVSVEINAPLNTHTQLNSIANNKAVNSGKLKLLEAMNHFKIRHIPEGIAEILMALPKDIAFADVVCCGFDTIMALDKLFFAHDHPCMSRKDLVYIPQIYALDSIQNPPEYLSTCARIYQEVVKDVDIRFVYGEVDLGWIADLRSPELVICIVKYAIENGNLRLLRVGDMFTKAGRDHIDISDDDVETLCNNMLNSVGFDFSHCPLLTVNSVRSLTRIQNLRILNLDYGTLIDDIALALLTQPMVNVNNNGGGGTIAPFTPTKPGMSGKAPLSLDTPTKPQKQEEMTSICIAAALEVLSLAGLAKITDEGLKKVAANTGCLKVLNVNHCSQLTSDVLVAFAKVNKRMHTLKLSTLQIDDAGLNDVCLNLSADFMTNVDLSFCREITDFGLITLSEVCPKLKTLNICSMSRVTDLGVARLLTNCWFLEDLNLEDIFLLDDKAFWFNSAFDGRPAANELMLKSLITLNLKDCVHLSDHGVIGLSERCRKIENLTLSGCEKITNTGLISMQQNVGYQISMCDSLKTLDLSYCAGITATEGILQLLPSCACLEYLNVSGITSVDDAFIHQLCLVCKTIQGLVLQKCVQITNLSLCSISDFLWIETLDITNCSKITDEGIEVLSTSCTGLLNFHLRRLNKVTARGLNAISRNCNILEVIDVRDCLNVTEQAVKDLKAQHRLTKVLSSYQLDGAAAAKEGDGKDNDKGKDKDKKKPYNTLKLRNKK